MYEKNIKASDYSFYIENIFELYKQGLIRNIGISNETPYGLTKLIQEIKTKSIQINLHLFPKSPNLTIRLKYSLIFSGSLRALGEFFPIQSHEKN